MKYRLPLFAIVLFTTLGAQALRAEDGLPVAEVKQEEPVDFAKQVLPILRKNCLACHNSSEAESDLVLEQPAAILKGGGEGPAVVPGKSNESLLFKVASHQAEPIMPPEDNDVEAKNLTPEELGLIKLWIDQGAKGGVGVAAAIEWQPLPPGVNPIYAAAVSADGQFAAAGRANQIFVYHVPSKRTVGRLTDPELVKAGKWGPGVAHLDLIQSMAFSPNSSVMASGGYRTVKIWNRPANVRLAELSQVAAAPTATVVDPTGKRAAIGLANGSIQLIDLYSGKITATLSGHQGPVTGVAFSRDSQHLVSGSQDKTFRLWKLADSSLVGEAIATPAAVNSVALVAEDQQIATAGADNVVRLWALPKPAPPVPAEPAAEKKDADAEKAADAPATEAKPEATAEVKPAEPAKPIREMKHAKPVTHVVSMGQKGEQLASSSLDATVRIWTVANGAQVRALSHGGPVEYVAVRADGQRIVSVSSNKIAKLWDANGKQLAELKGDFQAAFDVAEADRAAKLEAKKVDLAKKDVDAAKKRKESEEKNLKTATETLAKAQEDLKKKKAEFDKQTAAKTVADQAVTTAKAEVTAAETSKATATKAVADATAAQKNAVAAVTKSTQELKVAQQAADQAAAKLKQAQEAAAKDVENKDLATAAASAADAAKLATEKMQAGAAAKIAADKAKQEADAAKTAADAALKTATAALVAATNKVKQQEAATKKLDAPLKKATDEHAAAERTLQASTRTVERGKTSVKTSADAIPVAEQVVKHFEARQKERQAALATVTQQAASMEAAWRRATFSADGKTIATAGDSSHVYLWDAENGAALDRLSGHSATVRGLMFRDDQHLVTVAEDLKTIVWNSSPNWTLARTIGSPDSAEMLVDRVTALAFSPDGKLLATGSGEPSRSGTIKIWEVATGKLVRAIEEPHSDTVFGLEFSKEGTQLASCAADRFVKVFDVATGKHVRSFEGHTHHVLDVAWSADERTLASSGADKAVKIWDVRTGDQKRNITGFAKEVTSITFVADGINVAVSCGDKNVFIKRSDNGGNIRTFGGAGDYVYAVSVTADGKTIVSGGQDSVLRIWSDNGQVQATFEPPKAAEQTAKKQP